MSLGTGLGGGPEKNLERRRGVHASILAAALAWSGAATAQVWPVGALGEVDLAPGEGVGSGFLVADVDADGRLDLAYAAGDGGRGSVRFHRSLGRELIHLGTATGQAGDRCGSALAAGRFASNPDVVRPHLVVGCPGASSNAGLVRIYRVRASDDQLVLVRELRMGVDGLPSGDAADVRFGESLAVGDFDGDGADDLAIGAPEEDITVQEDADDGVVILVYGAFSGLDPSTAEVWTQDTPGVPDQNDPDDFFGYALAAGDFDGDDFDDLAVGAPLETTGAAEVSGAVTILYGSAGGLGSAGAQWLTQGDGIVPGVAEDADQFGEVLAAGRVVSDDGTGGPGADEDDLVVGVAGEGLTGADRAGVVILLVGRDGGFTAAGAEVFSQAGLPGATPELFDGLGSALALADFSNDGWADIAVAADGEDVGSVMDHGVAHVVLGGRAGLDVSGAQLLLPTAAFPFTPLGELDRFATRLAGGDFDGDGHADLAVGSPFWDYRFPDPDVVDAGNVTLLWGALFADGFDAGDADGW